MDYAVECEALTKKKRTGTVLHEVTLRVPRGSVYAVTGDHGEGGEAMLRILTGLSKPDSGSFSLLQTASTSPDIALARRSTGAVSGFGGAYLFLSAQENLQERLQLLGRKDVSMIPALLRLTGLSKAATERVKNFSPALRQRLALAMALCAEPELLLLTEPFAPLDAADAQELRQLLSTLNRQFSMTILISTEDCTEVAGLATHYALLSGGRLHLELTAQDLERKRRIRRVAEVSDAGAFCTAMDTLKLPYVPEEGRLFAVPSKLSVTELSELLSPYGCEILRLSEQEESTRDLLERLKGGNAE